MILQKLRVENVKCFEDLDLTFVPGKNVIIGHNGAGKSTILQSILYSLFHEYPQGKLDGMIRHGERAAEFELEFEHEGQKYSIGRTLRKSGSPTAHLFVNSRTDPLGTTQTSVTDAISETLHTRKEIFRDVIFVRQGEIAQIVGMAARDRKTLFDKLLGIHDYAQAWSKCRQLESTLEAKLSESKEIINAYKPTADKLLERRKSLKQLKDELKRIKKLRKELLLKQKEAKEEWGVLHKLDGQIGTLDTQIETLKDNIMENNAKKTGHNESYENLLTELAISAPASITTLLARLAKEHIAIEKELEDKRDVHQTLVVKNKDLTRYLKDKKKLQIEISNLDDKIQQNEKGVLSGYSNLKGVPYDEWPEYIKQEISKQKTRQTKVQELLKDARGIERKVDKMSISVQNHEDSVKKFQSLISKNEAAAIKVGGKGWKSLAKRSKTKLKRDLETTATRLKETETKEEKLLGEIGRTENNVTQLNEEMKNLQTLAGKKCPKCKQIVDETHAADLQTQTESKLERATGTLDDLRKKLKTTKFNLAMVKKREKDLGNSINLTEQLSIFLSSDTGYKKDIDKIIPKLKKVKEELEEAEAELSNFEIMKLEEEERQLDTTLQILNDLKGDVKILLSDITNRIGKDEDFETVSLHILVLQKLSLETNIPELEETIDSLKDRRDKIQALTNIGGILSELEKQISEWETDLKKKNRILGQTKKQFNQERYDALTKKLNELRDSITELSTEINQLADHRIPTAQEIYDESEKSAKAIETKQHDYEKATQALSVLSKIREFYREVQKPLRVRDVRRASLYATEVFKSVIGSTEFDRVMITEDHDLMISRFGELEPMRALSGGEQVLAALAVRLGFAQALVGNDLLILDEPTAYLDDTRRAELVQTLANSSPAKQMLIVTHDDDFKSVAQKIIRVQKDDSTLVSNVRSEM